MNLYAVSSLLAAIFCGGLSFFVYFKSGRNDERRSFSAVTFLIGIWTLFPYLTIRASDQAEALNRARLVYVAALFVPSLFFQFMLHTMRIAHEQKERAVLRSSYIAALFFLAFIASPVFIREVVANAPYAVIRPGLLYFFFVLYFGYMYFHASHRLFRLYHQSTGHFREHLKYIGLAFILAFLAGVMHFGSAFGIPEIVPHDFLVISYSGIIAFAIIKYRLMDLRVAIARTVILITVYTSLLGLPFVTFSQYQKPLYRLIQVQPELIPVLVAMYALLASCCPFFYLALQRRAEDRLYAEQKRYQAILRQASQGMTLIKELDRLLNLVVHLLTQKVRLKHAAIYLWNDRSKRFVLTASRQWDDKQVPTFEEADPLPKYFHQHRTPIVTEELQLLSESKILGVENIVSALKSLDAAVVVPSFVEDHCLGFLVLGEKKSGALYTHDDLQVFQVLANQAALAIENAQFYDELKRTQTDLFQTAKMASLGHMAGGMSHQINNRFHVLTILAGTLKATLKDLDPTSIEAERLREFWARTLETLTKIEENALRGGDIVKTILKFSRPAQEYRPVSVAQIIATTLEVVSYRVNLSLVDVVQEIPQDIPQVKGDLNQLADSLFNLVTNAYDAIQKKAEMIQEKQIGPSPKDSMPYRGKLHFRVHLEPGKEKSWVVLEVSDNGIGITKEELANLFIPFFTTKATTEKGTGLGLYVIQRIFEQHGGTIMANSTYGAGTTFTLKLPALLERLDA